MECKLNETEPSSTHPLLYQQVQEQSEQCDVTVRLGDWEMLFHWCVLVTSPFFEAIDKTCYIEKKTGKVILHIGTPSVVKDCLEFLYSREPELTEDNVSGILQVAEFLMIPNLKAMCINWLDNCSVTVDSCYKLLELSSIYEFELPKCTEFIRGHLPDMLKKMKMLNITYDSVQLILSDPTLCYVSMEEKLRFLIRWTKMVPERYGYFAELFPLIELKDLSRVCLKTIIKTEHLVMELTSLDYLEISSIVFDGDKMQKVLMLHSNNRTLYCLDIQRNNLRRVDITKRTEIYDYEDIKIKGVNAIENTDVYKEKVLSDADSSIKYRLLINNLETDLTLETKVAIMAGNADVRNDFLVVANNECWAIVKCKKNIRTTIYIGTLTSEITPVYPIFAFSKQSFVAVCVNEANVLAMLSDGTDTLFLYDRNNCELDKLRLRRDYNYQSAIGDKLVPSTKGFVIYNDTRAFCMTRLAGPALRCKYKMYSYVFDKKIKTKTHRFCGNKWYRLNQNYTQEVRSTISYTTHADILATERGRNISWRYFSLPLKGITIGSKMYAMNIPKKRLTCHTNCPHCQQAT